METTRLNQTMTRPFANYSGPESWDDLPEEFTYYLDVLDKIRIKKVNEQVVDPLYPSYDYDWELDEEIPLTTILYYWNNLDKELPEPDKLLDEINEGMGEAAYDDYVSSYYSY